MNTALRDHIKTMRLSLEDLKRLCSTPRAAQSPRSKKAPGIPRVYQRGKAKELAAVAAPKTIACTDCGRSKVTLVLISEGVYRCQHHKAVKA